MTVDELMAVQPVIPVITVERVEDAIPLASALAGNGLRVLEVTLRTPAALACIREMTKVSGAIVGAGTVLSANDAMLAREAGATFIVTPGLSAATVAAARESEIPILPGIATATELMQGLDLGLTRVKFFPAEQAGGAAYLKSIGSPIPQVSFCPTGGISLKIAPDYLALKNILCVGGSWVAPKEAMARGDWAAITALAREAAALPRSL